jgi:periplasmic protein TonB
MLEYAASRRKVASRPSSPNAMLLIISAHVALLALVMSAKMDLPRKLIYDSPTRIDLVPEPSPPRPQPIMTHSPQPQPIENPQPQVPTAPTVQPTIEATPSIDFGKILGPSTSPTPAPQPMALAPVRQTARLVTPPSELKPPYPASKIASEEEATLRLRLTIDERGRVIAVDPVGPADREFLDAARRYMIAHWRYQPATEDGRAVASTLTVTLRFQLDL